MTKTIEAPPQQRVAPPRDCSFHPTDWDVLSRSWFPVARTDEVTDRPAKARLLDVDLVIYRTSCVARVARDLCFHRGAALSMGWVEGHVIVCPYHGFRYGPDGRCTGVPAHPDMAIPPKLRIITFPTTERFGLIWTTLNGDDESLPDFEAWDDPDFQAIMAPTIDINGSAGRQVEGFLDVAHFAWAHTETFGDRFNPTVPSYKVERTGRGIASPISARKTRLFCPLARNFDKDSSIEAVHEFNFRIFNEDRMIVESQRPEDLLLDIQMEAHVAADRTSIDYRKLLKEMGLGSQYIS